ncbi:alpha kinase/elongation factor 2 kinase [Anaeramoeba flamelloides]|uniref:Alpha kinase/elongation factor 2 kinase n=1 Tax=Anaeramoeba flamelloides TaxID=1746091 RepID=A0ABQ8YTB4_9EUKA|nr:alpha kinase/elongation factor 2 kinase [Anaeramoeba flamelloides]
MSLYQKKKMCTSYTGKKFKITSVITFVYKYFLSELMKTLSDIRDSEKKFKKKDIFWVLTVPAIWKENAKHNIRKCAKRAGMIDSVDSKSLILIREPVAAAIEVFYGNYQIQNLDQLKPGKIMILDAGSGTIDITILKLVKKDQQTNLQICLPAQGGELGSKNVDDQFKKNLKIFLQIEQKDPLPISFLQTFKKWMITKHRATMKYKYSKEKPNKKIPIYNSSKNKPSLSSLIKKWNNDKYEGHKEYIGTSLLQSKNSILIKETMVFGFFEKPISEIIKWIKIIFNKNKELLSDLHTIVMVGGFSTSNILYKSIKREFHKKKVILAVNPERAVLYGAVTYGDMDEKRRNEILTSRPLAFGIGYKILTYFNPFVHPKNKKIVKNGICYAKDVYKPLFQKNVPIMNEKINQEKIFLKGKNLRLEIYQTDEFLKEDETYFVDDTNFFRKFGHLEIHNLSKNKNGIEIILNFNFKNDLLTINGQCQETGSFITADIKYNTTNINKNFKRIKNVNINTINKSVSHSESSTESSSDLVSSSNSNSSSGSSSRTSNNSTSNSSSESNNSPITYSDESSLINSNSD